MSEMIKNEEKLNEMDAKNLEAAAGGNCIPGPWLPHAEPLIPKINPEPLVPILAPEQPAVPVYEPVIKDLQFF